VISRWRVVLDTNVVISALLFRAGALAWMRTAWSEGSVVPIVSTATMHELIRVLNYSKFKLSAQEQKQALALYLPYAETVAKPRTRARLPDCRDADDRMLLELAYAAKADALVTGDFDLLAVAPSSRIPIITAQALRAKSNL
jgi:uncharacterized protein